MARTPFNVRLIAPGDPGGPVSYTVPAGKYIIVNAFAAPPVVNTPPTGTLEDTTSVLIMNGTRRFFIKMGSYGRVGPYCFNAGDVLSTDAQYVPMNIAPPGLNGFLYDTSTVKVPFTQTLVPSSSIYTVPAGKIAIFNVFLGSSASPFVILMNGIVAGGVPSYAQNYYPSLATRVGPMVAKGGDVISAGNQGYASVNVQINGFLYNS